MPTQQTGSRLMKKYGARLDAAVKKTAHNEIKIGSSRVPPGIINGIAHLTTCEFAEVAAGKQNAGELYFRAAGTVIEPEFVMVDGQRIQCRGCQTSIFEMVCDTKDTRGKVTSIEDHVDRIQNYLKMLGASAEDLERGGPALEEIAKALENDGHIYFRLSTSKREGREYIDPKTKQKKKGEDGVWENWYGIKGSGFDLTDYKPSEAVGSNGYVDNTGIVDHTEPDSVLDNEEPDSNPDGAEDDPYAVIDELLGRANAKNAEAQEELSKLAVARGWDSEVVDAADTWQEVADMAKSDPSVEGASGEEEVWTPKVNEVCKYVPRSKDGKPLIDPRSKKPVKPLQCEVLSLNKDGTFNLRNLDDGKTVYKSVQLEYISQ